MKKRDYLQCEIAEMGFGKTTEATHHKGDVSVKWLSDSNGTTLETGAREYQREKVSSEEFKQGILLTILLGGFKTIPTIHIRAKKKGKVYFYELVDGQQRVTAILDFLNGTTVLPSNTVIDGCDVSGLSAKELLQDFPNLYNKIIDYRISCVWYENINDAQTAELFIKILNNVNTMNWQEMRNAIRGLLSKYIRNTARFENVHKLFATTVTTTSKKTTKTLVHFSKKFKLKGRMEIDAWLSQNIYMLVKGFRNGVTDSGLMKWVEKVQAENGDYSTKVTFGKFKKEIDNYLDFGYSVITSVDSKYKERLTPMLSTILIQYGYELKNKNGKLNVSTYTNKFFSVYTKWSDIKNRLWNDKFMPNGTPMKPFNEMFGGLNANAIGGICSVLDEELKADTDSFGVVKLDARETFAKGLVLKRWYEQGCIDFYTGLPLDEEDIAGDHYIPRSHGVKAGGVTEYHNLVVCSQSINKQKLNQHGDEFRKQFDFQFDSKQLKSA